MRHSARVLGHGAYGALSYTTEAYEDARDAVVEAALWVAGEMEADESFRASEVHALTYVGGFTVRGWADPIAINAEARRLLADWRSLGI
jgi:enhancing lycopene biosynthesis protein 2